MAETNKKRGWIVLGVLLVLPLIGLFVLWSLDYGVLAALVGILIFVPVAFLLVWMISHLIDWAFGGKR